LGTLFNQLVKGTVVLVEAFSAAAVSSFTPDTALVPAKALIKLLRMLLTR
jgi:hypothetical protein